MVVPTRYHSDEEDGEEWHLGGEEGACIRHQADAVDENVHFGEDGWVCAWFSVLC
jgi:hypothetical protein